MINLNYYLQRINEIMIHILIVAYKTTTTKLINVENGLFWTSNFGFMDQLHRSSRSRLCLGISLAGFRWLN